MKNNLLLSLILIPFIGYSQLTDTTTTSKNEDVFTIVESMPEFSGGQDGLFKYLASNMHYPNKAKENGIQGTVFVNFIIGSNGMVRDVKVIRGVHKLLDDEALRVVQLMPKWTPGTQKGKTVSVSYNLPIKFTLSNNTVDCEKKEYTIVDKMPKFKGDLEKLNAQFSVAMRVNEKEFKTNGTLNVQVVIDCNGIPKDFKLVKGLKSTIDKRVIEELQKVTEFRKWEAGSNEGTFKNCQYNIPIELKNGFFIFKTI